MRQVYLSSFLILATLSTAVAQRFTLPKQPDYQHEISIGPRVMSGVSIDFGGIGNADPFNNRDDEGLYFNNGYVIPDDKSEDGLTSFFGYRSKNQFVDSEGEPTEMLSAADRLEYSRYTLQSGATSLDADADMSYGWDAQYTYFLSPKRTWGISAGFAFNRIGTSASQQFSGELYREDYSFDLNDNTVLPTYNDADGNTLIQNRYTGLTPSRPVIPVEGESPKYLIPVSPSGSEVHQISDNYTGQGSWDLDAGFYSFRLGPTYNLSLGESFEVRVSLGVSAIYLDSSFEATESFLIPNADNTAPAEGETGDDERGSIAITDRENSRQGEWLFGGYADAGARYKFTDRLSVFSTLEYQTSDDSSQSTDDGRTVDIDLASQYYLRAGFGFNF